MAAFVGSLASFTGSAYADTLCGLELKSIEQIRDDVTKGHRTELHNDNEASIQFADGQNLILWTFLKPAHPASPAVICQTPIVENGVTVILLQSRCAGPKPDCDALIAEFEAQHDEMARRLSETSTLQKP